MFGWQSGQCACFAIEAGQPLGVAGNFLWQDLDGNIPAQALIMRTEHLSHAPGAKLPVDALVREDLANHEDRQEVRWPKTRSGRFAGADALCR